MSVTFYLAPYSPTKWAEIHYSYVERLGDFAIDIDRYQEALRQSWKNIKLHKPVNKDYILEWELPPSRPNFAGLQGKLSANCQIVTFGSGPKESFLSYIRWHRNFVASKYDLYLFSSISKQAFPLKADTSMQEVVDFTGIID